MQALRTATFAGRLANSVRFDLEAGWRCEVFVLADDLIRVLFLHKETFREPRSWTVAPGDADVPWEGRDRRDVTGFGCPAFAVAENEHEVTLTTEALSLQVTLRPFGLRWSANDQMFAADRGTYAYQWSERKNIVAPLHGACAQIGTSAWATRPVRWTCTAGACARGAGLAGLRPRDGDPLYKHWPFVLGRDRRAGSGVWHVLRHACADAPSTWAASTTTTTASTAT